MVVAGGSTLVESSSLPDPRNGAFLERKDAVFSWTLRRAAWRSMRGPSPRAPLAQIAAAALLGWAAGCGASAHPAPSAPPTLWELSAPGLRLRAVSWAAGAIVVATNRPKSDGQLEGRVEAQGRWTATLEGAAGPLAALGEQLLAVEQPSQELASLVMLGAADGRVLRRVPIQSTDAAVLAELASCGDFAALAGSFTGTLRVGEQVVSTAGQRDGFVATIDPNGHVTALVRMGGDGDDGFTAVACRGRDLAVVGTFSEGAELRGVELQRIAAGSPASDGVLARLQLSASATPPATPSLGPILSARNLAVTWTRTFGSGEQDLPSDVAITARGDVAVVGVARGEIALGAQTLTTQGVADGYLARWSASGEPLGALRLGGPDYDAATRVLAVGDRLIVAGFFSGAMELGGSRLTAGGGDDAMIVSMAANGAATPLAISGDGREEIVSLTPSALGIALGIAHTAGFQAFGLRAAAPADAMGGAAVVVVPAL
jgi:hypothetical protein